MDAEELNSAAKRAFLSLKEPLAINSFGRSVFFVEWNGAPTNGLITLPETNIAPENEPLETEIPIGNHHF